MNGVKMVNLDFQTNNPRWGMSGICFSSVESYAFVLGFLTQVDHYKTGNDGSRGLYESSIEIVKENNQKDSAWNKEYRIHYFKENSTLANLSKDLEKASSAGRGNNIKCRINSNRYIEHLIEYYYFQPNSSGPYVNKIFPTLSPEETLKKVFNNNPNIDKVRFRQEFTNGYNI